MTRGDHAVSDIIANRVAGRPRRAAALSTFRNRRGAEGTMTHVNFAQPDVTLMLDSQGIIRQASLSGDMRGEPVVSWVGRPWVETVGESAGESVRRMVEEARTVGVSAFSQVNQRFPSGLELPIEYTTVRLGSKAGLIAIGKNLQAVAELQSRLLATQHAREQDYWKLRDIETRSRLLFDASNEAVLLLRADTLRVAEANPAAMRALGIAPGWDFLPEVAPADQDTLKAMLVRVRQQGRAPGILVRLGAQGEPWIVRASVMAAEPGPMLLLQLAHAGAEPAQRRHDGPPMDDLIERLPEGFVALDRHGVIRRANRVFLDMAEVGAEAVVVGKSMDRWLSRPGATLSVLLANLLRHGTVRRFATTIHGELGTEIEVEISAAGNSDSDSRYFGVLIRDVTRRAAEIGADAPDRLNAALRSVAGQIGRTPLLDLVRATAATVERHCILAALELSEGNRTAAAEMLGLSRQSLYAKLNRYGFEMAAPPTAENAALESRTQENRPVPRPTLGRDK
jgi:transcriptional regulator PpsR